MFFCSGQETKITFPSKEWEQISNEESKEWDASKLSGLRKFIIDSANTTGMLVIYRGKILFQYGNISDNSYLASCRKSIVSMLYGPFVKSGKINLTTTLEQLGINDVGGLLPLEKKATIQDILTARSGVFHPASNGGDAADAAPPRGSSQPGSYFLYNNWDFNVAGYILEKESGQEFYNIVDSVLAKPLMLQDWSKNIQRKVGDTTRSQYKAYHLWFSTRDMARLGYLMLRNGIWQGKSVLPLEWVKRITTTVTDYTETIRNRSDYYNLNYGYFWWLWNNNNVENFYRGGYTASGAYGQFITVLPLLDLVIAHKTNYDDYGRSTRPATYFKIIGLLLRAYKE
jgi:CubicO group peptidase (beta-lactamase class C family)